MKKSILRMAVFAVITALFCVGCNNNETGGDTGDVDGFLGLFNGKHGKDITPPDTTMYTLTITATDGGTVLPDGIHKYKAGTSVNLTATANSGYTFTGWSGDTTSINAEITITMNRSKTLTANFQKDVVIQPTDTTYIITFDANGGTVTQKTGTTDTDGKLTYLPPPTRTDGYTFYGWYTATTDGDSVTTSTVFSKDTTIYARWTLNKYTVTFNSQGGSTVSSQSIDHGNTITKPADPTRPNYTFDGWYKETTYTTKWDFDNDVVTSAITLYAKWNANPGGGGKGNDIENYRTVVIGSQTWMAENLNYAGEEGNEIGACYENSPDSCAKYGRLYNWNDALTACPVGWHLPSDAEWDTLVKFVGGLSTAGEKLKSTSGWMSGGNGTDQYDFSALPGGIDYNIGGNSSNVGYYGFWWSATESNANKAWGQYMGFGNEDVGSSIYFKNYLLSVRCVQD